MTTFVQLHLLTHYGPANLNRDDTGRPKTVMMGGAERLRVSSPAIKRAVRTSAAFAEPLSAHIGTRTKRMAEEVFKQLIAAGRDEKEAVEIARQIAEVFGKPQKEGGEHPIYTEQLVHLAPGERDAIAALGERILAGESPEISDDLLTQQTSAVDIALFGRMLAAKPAFNVEAAAQVAHALTTHAVGVEDDYFTAVDDLNTFQEDRGAGHVGERGFGAGVFYLYVCLNTDLLVENLGGNTDLAGRAARHLVEALATTSPSGHQNSFASRSYASYIMAERGNAQPRQLSAAFLKPVRGQDVMAASIRELKTTKESLDACYGLQTLEWAEMNAHDGPSGSLADIAAFAGEAVQAAQGAA